MVVAITFHSSSSPPVTSFRNPMTSISLNVHASYPLNSIEAFMDGWIVQT